MIKEELKVIKSIQAIQWKKPKTNQNKVIESSSLNGSTGSMGCIHFVKYSNTLLLMSMIARDIQTTLK